MARYRLVTTNGSNDTNNLELNFQLALLILTNFVFVQIRNEVAKL